MVKEAIGQYGGEAIPVARLGIKDGEYIGQGVNKLVYKVDFRGRNLAAKIYRDREDATHKKQNREKGSLTEYGLYRSFKATPLGIYIPDAVGIIRAGNNRAIGLAVEWVNGKLLVDHNRSLLRQGELDLLKANFYETVERGIFPNLDMLSDENIFVSLGKKQRLSFAECGLSDLDQREYMEMVTKYFQDLQDDYVPN